MIKLKVSKPLMIVVAVTIILATALCLTSWFRILEIKETKAYRLQQIQDTEWMFVKAVLIENYDKAKLSAEIVKLKILKDVEKEYGNNLAKLQFDLDYPHSSAILYQIIHRSIANTWLNKESDSNDPFVFTTFGIVGDLSLDCSPSATEVTFRTWEQEYGQQANPVLAKGAVYAIVHRLPVPVFWEFLKSENPDHRMVIYMSIAEVEKTFRIEGLNGLKTYEFLNYAVLFDERDLVGRQLHSALGLKNNKAVLVYITQGFNLLDALEKNHPTDFLNTKIRQNAVITQSNAAVRHEMITLIGLLIVLFSALIASLIAQTVEVDTGERRRKTDV